MNEQISAQEARAERVQAEALALMRKRILGEKTVGVTMAVTRNQAEERLKTERAQARLTRMQGWKMLGEGVAIDRLRQFDDPLVAVTYLAFASLLARQVKQPLQISVNGGIIVMALTGRSSGPCQKSPAAQTPTSPVEIAPSTVPSFRQDTSHPGVQAANRGRSEVRSSKSISSRNARSAVLWALHCARSLSSGSGLNAITG